jgi:hypothetical protein
LNRVDITTSELGNLRRRFLFSIVQRAKVQPLSLPAKIEDQAVVVSRALSVSVDLTTDEPAFTARGNSFSDLVLEGINVARKRMPTVRKLTETAIDFVKIAVQPIAL